MFDVILAMTKEGGIGFGGKLPWHCREELSLFNKITTGSTLIVGRKTADSLPPLKDRTIVVLSSTVNYSQNASCLSNALVAYCGKKMFIAGGARVYNEVFTTWRGQINKVYLSVMEGEYKCDTFVNFDPLNWVIYKKLVFEKFTHYELLSVVSEEIKYLRLLKDVYENGCVKNGRNGFTKSVFGKTIEFDLTKGYPLLTTKAMFFRGIVEELLFFIRGDTDSKLLSNKKIKIWEGNTNREFLDSIGKLNRREGVMGPMYGYQWRHFNAEYNEEKAKNVSCGMDQLKLVVDQIRNDPDSRRILLTDFNPLQARDGVLYPCFLKNTIVLTDSGYMFIQDIKISDKLMTHTGKFQPINNIQKTLYKKNNIVKIKVSHHPHVIQTTPDHPFYTRKIIFLKKGGNNIGRELDEIKWVLAKDLTYEHYIGMKINNMDTIPAMSWVKKVNQHETKIITKTLENIDEWFLFGYFLGDGWIEWKRQSIFNLVFCYADENIITDLLQKLNITFSYKKRKNEGKCKTVVCTNYQLWKIFTEFGHKAHNKRIPEWVQNAPIKYIQKFVDGYTMADGNKIKNGLKYTTVSKNIAFGLQRLYLKLGKVLKVYYQQRKPTTVILGRTVNQRNTYSLDWIEQRKISSAYVFDSGYIWYKPSFIDQVVHLDPVTVYNFDVNEDHTYCVENLIVHNCHSIVLQFYVQDGYLDMFCFNRSSDLFHGLPFNIASSSLFQILIAKITGLTARRFVLSLGDCHIYESHYDVVVEQLRRIPFLFTNVEIKKELKSLEDIEKLEYGDFELVKYVAHGSLKADMVS